MRPELGGSPWMISWLLTTFNPSSPEWLWSLETDRSRSSKTQQRTKNKAADILDKCQLTHPIAYDTFNLCALNASISINMFRLICEYFDLDVCNIPRSRKVLSIELFSKALIASSRYFPTKIASTTPNCQKLCIRLVVGTARISTLEKQNVDCTTEKLNILNRSRVVVVLLVSQTMSCQLVTTRRKDRGSTVWLLQVEDGKKALPNTC